MPFVEVDLGGWDTHNNNLQDARRHQAARAGQGDEPPWSSDLDERGLLEDTAIIWMGEFGRTPRINGNRGRDHWARSWSVVVGGPGMKGGIAVGRTNADGTEVDDRSLHVARRHGHGLQVAGHLAGNDLHQQNGRPMKIANGGKVIKELFA